MRAAFLALLLAALAMPLPAQQPAPARTSPPAWLGVTYDLHWLAAGPTGCEARVVVASVVPGSPAERAGLRAGDAILAMDGDPQPAARLAGRAPRLAPGDRVRLRIRRDGSDRELTVVADRRPDRLVVQGAAPVPPRTPAGPLLELRADTLVATDFARIGPGSPTPRAGYWLRTADGRTTYRPVDTAPATDLDRRAAVLLACADAGTRALAVAGIRPELDRIQERADSLRAVFTRRALEQEDQARRLYLLPERRPGASPAPGAPPRAMVVLRAEEALAAGLRGVAGAELVAMEPELAEYFRGVTGGLLVLRVAPGTPAGRAGLRPGDVITAAGGREATGPADLRALLAAPEAGPLELTVVRQGRRRTVSVPRP
jgi:membrane-associated protease RseP (regulator of RpoE activity)